MLAPFFRVNNHLFPGSTGHAALSGRALACPEGKYAPCSPLLWGPTLAGGGLDLTQLSIVSGKTCWVLYVDALVLNMDGNVLDALSLAAKAALADTRVPKVWLGVGDGEAWRGCGSRLRGGMARGTLGQEGQTWCCPTCTSMMQGWEGCAQASGHHGRARGAGTGCHQCGQERCGWVDVAQHGTRCAGWRQLQGLTTCMCEQQVWKPTQLVLDWRPCTPGPASLFSPTGGGDPGGGSRG